MRIKEFLAPIVYLASNLISQAGVVLVTTSGILWLFLLPSFLKGGAETAYLGILEFMVLPMVFFAGLGLIPIGIWWYKKRNRGKLPTKFPPLISPIHGSAACWLSSPPPPWSISSSAPS